MKLQREDLEREREDLVKWGRVLRSKGLCGTLMQVRGCKGNKSALYF
jgi:hypothetical protein